MWAPGPSQPCLIQAQANALFIEFSITLFLSTVGTRCPRYASIFSMRWLAPPDFPHGAGNETREQHISGFLILSTHTLIFAV